MVALAQEFCPECGDFVESLNERSGWCKQCSFELGYVDASRQRSERPRQGRVVATRSGRRGATHCGAGHEYVTGSWKPRPDGRGKICIECRRKYDRKRRLLRKEAMDNDPNHHWHGTNWGIRVGCQCERCRELRKILRTRKRVN